MHDILAALTPIYKLMRYLGFAPYTIEGPPKRRYVKQSFKYELTTTLIHLIIIGYSTYIYIRGMRYFSRKSMLFYLGSVLYLLSEISFMLITPIFNKIQNKRTISTLTRLYEVERKFTKIGVRLNYNYLHNTSNVIVVATFVIFSTYFWSFGISLIFPNGKLHLLNVKICVLFYYLNVLQILTTAQFLVSFKILDNMFLELNGFASTKISKNGVSKLRNIAAIHQDLCQISRNFNRILSAKTLFLFCTFFVVLTLHVFGITLTLINGKHFDTHTTFSFTTTVFCFGTIAVYTIVSSQCVEQARRTKKILFKISANSDEPTLKREVKAFSLQIIHEEFRITAGGFFTIDFSLLTTMVGTMITYITILVQYDPTTNVKGNVINY